MAKRKAEELEDFDESSNQASSGWDCSEEAIQLGNKLIMSFLEQCQQDGSDAKAVFESRRAELQSNPFVNLVLASL